ncbi:GyrI-like domain-containing protein [Lederbergia graminis]|uniref:GyrI-like domain-containing protein n=1 Tax=Lederbergia graminis TaxID=735518 RepID=A0ABW0LIK8_9BACI
MADYLLEEKDGFNVLGIGTELKSDYMDFAGINKEKADFWQAVHEDGTIDKLREIAANDYLFVVNEAVNNKMMHYVGVMTKESLPEASRMIQFPKGEYIVVKGKAESEEELSNKLTGIAFGQVLQEANNVAYVGGPNTAVLMGNEDDLKYGEMWIPVIRK